MTTTLGRFGHVCQMFLYTHDIPRPIRKLSFTQGETPGTVLIRMLGPMTTQYKNMYNAPQHVSTCLLTPSYPAGLKHALCSDGPQSRRLFFPDPFWRCRGREVANLQAQQQAQLQERREKLCQISRRF